MTSERVRLDRWLWAARFYKTRAQAHAAVEGGKVRINGVRAKASKSLAVGNELRIRKGAFEFLVVVRSLADQRGPATVARTLYEEDAASVTARQALSSQIKARPTPVYEGKGRPTKRDRRRLDQWHEERSGR
ncbi:MAG: RNA-binding S4 domain-containing protein [Gemmatimonadetes bacterium]|nr:RNA-binding S4 domain-containing protein [Gemmatimonadota bacterium]